jgi:hypothetical protein
MSGDETGATRITQRELLLEMREDIRALRSAVTARLGAKRHLADLRARSGLSTEQLIYRGRADGWLVVGELEPSSDREDPAAL